MSNLDKQLRMLNMPREMVEADHKILEEVDVTELFGEWASRMAKDNIYHKNYIEWNPPREQFVLHPSSVDNPCDFYLYLQMVGGPGKRNIPDRLQMVFDTGTAIHAQMQYYQESRAKYFRYSYQPEVGFHPRNNLNCKVLKMGGHADGVSHGWPFRYATTTWEYKSINKASFEKLVSPHTSYVKQVHLYMLALGSPIAILVYICKDNDAVKAFKLPYLNSVARPLLERIFYIRNCALEMKDPEKRISSGGKRCEFVEECSPDLSSIKRLGLLPRRL